MVKGSSSSCPVSPLSPPLPPGQPDPQPQIPVPPLLLALTSCLHPNQEPNRQPGFGLLILPDTTLGTWLRTRTAQNPQSLRRVPGPVCNAHPVTDHTRDPGKSAPVSAGLLVCGSSFVAHEVGDGTALDAPTVGPSWCLSAGKKTKPEFMAPFCMPGT